VAETFTKKILIVVAFFSALCGTGTVFAQQQQPIPQQPQPQQQPQPSQQQRLQTNPVKKRFTYRYISIQLHTFK